MAAHPFRARDAGTAEALLAAMHAVRDPETQRTGLAIEDHEALVEHLIGLGGEVQYRMRHLAAPIVRGPLPLANSPKG